MKTRWRVGRLAIPFLLTSLVFVFADKRVAAATRTVRVAAAQAAGRVVDFRLLPNEALAAVEKNLSELVRIVDRAGEAKCDVLVLPEDTPGLLHWVGANETLVKTVLPKAVNRMLERLGRAASLLLARTSSFSRPWAAEPSATTTSACRRCGYARPKTSSGWSSRNVAAAP